MIRRINICGGPGIGKSSVAAKLYAGLKQESYSVELATEYVKGWAYLNREIVMFDQFYLVNKQLQQEYVPLKAGVDHIVTDSPIFLPYCYAFDISPKIADAILPIVDLFDEYYKPLYVFLNRETEYDQEGRYQNIDEAMRMDRRIRDCLEMRGKDFIDISLKDDIVEIIKEQLS